eukprot:1553421-Pleurochrysis_carterae.AAC.3
MAVVVAVLPQNGSVGFRLTRLSGYTAGSFEQRLIPGTPPLQSNGSTREEGFSPCRASLLSTC